MRERERESFRRKKKKKDHRAHLPRPWSWNHLKKKEKKTSIRSSLPGADFVYIESLYRGPARWVTPSRHCRSARYTTPDFLETVYIPRWGERWRETEDRYYTFTWPERDRSLVSEMRSFFRILRRSKGTWSAPSDPGYPSAMIFRRFIILLREYVLIFHSEIIHRDITKSIAFDACE